MAVGREKKKGPKKKEKMVFAKDKKQAVLAMVVLALFLGNTVYMIVKYFIDQNAYSVSSQPSTAEELARKQKENLDILSGGSVKSPEELAASGVNNSAGATSTSGADAMDNLAQDTNNIYDQTVNMQPQANPQVKGAQAGEDIDIMTKQKFQKNGKTVLITVSASGRSNPFLPAGENFSPAAFPYLTAPPETLPSNSDAGKVMTTVISGILYDRYSPSAILNIEGTDYLVKKGDVINRYKVLSITKDQVLVQLGHNVYKAGVGELLSLTDLKFNTIANLHKKFGGNEVPINVKRKGY